MHAPSGQGWGEGQTRLVCMRVLRAQAKRTFRAVGLIILRGLARRTDVHQLALTFQVPSTELGQEHGCKAMALRWFQ